MDLAANPGLSMLASSVPVLCLLTLCPIVRCAVRYPLFFCPPLSSHAKFFFLSLSSSHLFGARSQRAVPITRLVKSQREKVIRRIPGLTTSAVRVIPLPPPPPPARLRPSTHLRNFHFSFSTNRFVASDAELLTPQFL
jgi:hypothetical protein